MTTQRWVEILVVCVVLGGLGWLSITVFSMNGTLSRVETAAEDTSKRLDRIASVLPDVRVRIAEEELRRAIDIALVCNKPIKQSEGSWSIAVQLFDFATRELTRYALEVDDTDDRAPRRIQAALRGAPRKPEEVAYFDQLLRWAEVADKEFHVPDDVDAECSFVARTGNRERHEEALERYRTVLSLYDSDAEGQVSLDFRNRRLDDLMALLASEEQGQPQLR